MEREYGGRTFRFIEVIKPHRNEKEIPYEYMPQNRYGKADCVPLNAHGKGPFCRFDIAEGIHQPGVYIVTLNGDPTYVGRCIDLALRWGPQQYGSISPKNCYKGGQSTNCKINNLILQCYKSGDRLELWFHETNTAKPIERDLIICLKPKWNSQIPW